MSDAIPYTSDNWQNQGMAKKLKRPRDPISLAKLIGDIATGQVKDVQPGDENSAAAKGGAARAAKMSPERRAEIAKKAAAKRWGKIS